MATAARHLFRNGKSLPQVLRTPFVGRSSVNMCEDRQIVESLINQAENFYIQQAVFGSRFGFVRFDLVKNHELSVENWKCAVSPAAVDMGRLEARRGSGRSDNDFDSDAEPWDDDNLDFREKVDKNGNLIDSDEDWESYDTTDDDDFEDDDDDENDDNDR